MKTINVKREMSHVEALDNFSGIGKNSPIIQTDLEYAPCEHRISWGAIDDIEKDMASGKYRCWDEVVYVPPKGPGVCPMCGQRYVRTLKVYSMATSNRAK